MFIFHQEKKYWELKESIRMMNSQRSDVEKISLIQESKKKKKKFPIQVMVEQWYYRNAQYLVVKSQYLLKIKKQKDY